MKAIFLVGLGLCSATVMADSGSVQTGTLIIDQRAKIDSNTLVYLKAQDWCGAPYTGTRLDDHGDGWQGVEQVSRLVDGQYVCDGTQFEDEGFMIAVVNLGNCHKTTTTDLDGVCTGAWALPAQALEVTCQSPQLHYHELRYRELIGEFWRRKVDVDIQAPNSQPYVERWLDVGNGEPFPGDSVGTPYIEIMSHWNIIKDKSTKDLKDVVFEMRAAVYKNISPITESQTPVVLSNDMVTCEYKCALTESNECGFSGISP